MVRHHPNGCAAVLFACGFLLTGVPAAQADGRLDDPAPAARLRAALALAGGHDPAAIPVLIDLLADLPAEQRRPAEEFLAQLAGEWAPVVDFASEDRIGRRIRRDAWAAWWRNTDGASLLALLRRHTIAAESQARAGRLIAQLGNPAFTAREKAEADLFDLGRLALPQLREATASRDADVARRVRSLIERIERDPAHLLPLAALRLLALRRPAGSVDALLAYLPCAEDETRSEELQQTLAALALREGRPDPALLRALSDSRPPLRIAAAEALIAGGGAAGRSAASRLVRDEAPLVRVRVALALARAGDRDGVPVMIDLLAVLPAEKMGEVEDALYLLAGDGAPIVPAGEKPEERKKCRDAWAAWWKDNAAGADLARLTARPWYGYTLLCDLQGNRVFEIDRGGRMRWSIEVPNPIDARVLPGNRVLVAEWGGNRVTERDLHGNILWEHAAGGRPVNVQRLPNGNTFIATYRGSMLEVDRAGKEVHTINGVPRVTAACRSPRGEIVARTQTGQCVRLDATGKQLGSFALPGGNGVSDLDLSANGRIVVVQDNKVVELDSGGKKLREWDAANAVTATALPNGHVLVASQNNGGVCELDRAGKVVWEYRGAGCYRARRR